ncbi:MAG: hypothetical protein ACSHX9_04675 [Luteolibacter sp.]
MKLSTKLIFVGFASVALFTSCNTTIGLARDMRVLSNEVEKKADETYNGPSGSQYSDGYTESGESSGDEYSGAAPVY